MLKVTSARYEGRDALDHRLAELGARPVLIRMAKAGQIVNVKCEMPKCYCSQGRQWFEEKSSRSRRWYLSTDHYPRLKLEGGRSFRGISESATSGATTQTTAGALESTPC